MSGLPSAMAPLHRSARHGDIMTISRLLATACAATLLATAVAAQSDTPLVPGATYDPAIPTVSSVLGYDSGERITRPADVRRYFEALKAQSPDRMAIGEYGQTHEGRPLFWAAVGTPANIARLDAIKAASRALADPRTTTPAEAQAILADQPVVVWLAYSVHGNEISPADASMAAARHLLASRDPAVQRWLANTVVVFVPTQNPDGRERFLSTFSAGYGTRPNPDGLSAERDEPWPSGRYNHDLFDLNRDWFIQTQPETRGHTAAVLDWRPQVLVDAHEMGTDQTFFFPPEAQPLNPWLTDETLASREMIGRNTARRFDALGIPYFTGQEYDAFYPGYGDGWPAYLGAVSMTYEQGSARGLAARRSSGEVFTYRDTVRNHFVASLSTIEAASDNRERLLANFVAYHRDGVAGSGAYVLAPAPHDPTAADSLAGLLVRQGLEVGRASAAFTACGRAYPAGSYVVNLAQPQRRMAEVLLARDVAVPAAFLAEQERRRARGLPDEIYDVTAWSLPLMFNVPTGRCNTAPSVAVAAVTPDRTRPLAVANAEASYGYLVAPGMAATRLKAAALDQGLSLRVMDRPFTHNGRNWPAGTLVMPRADNRAHDLTALTADWARRFGTPVTGIDDSWVASGPSFGSRDAVILRAPNIALAWDEPADPSAAGATRYVIEREFDYPVTAVRVATLSGADLDRYQVLVVPDGGNYAGTLGSGGMARLKAWVERGGTLVTLGRATRMVTSESAGMLASRRETAPKGDAPDDDNGPLIASDAEYQTIVGESERGPDSVAGVLAQARTDQEHWLSAGVAPNLNFLVKGSDIYTPLKRGEGTNLALFTSADTLLASGQLWAENRAQLAFKPAVMVAPMGRGQVIAFTQDATSRGYLDGLKVLFANALFNAPAHASPTWVD